jgi:hypothetical protein
MSTDFIFLRDDGETEVFVIYHLSARGAIPSRGNSGWAAEYDVDRVANAEGQEISSMLTKAEWMRLDDEVFKHGCGHADDGPDPDDLRDAAFDRETW